MTQLACKLGVVVVSPGALNPSDGDGIESRRPLLQSKLRPMSLKVNFSRTLKNLESNYKEMAKKTQS